MNDDQQELMDDVIDEMEERISTKYPKGVKKYGTVLHKDHTVEFLHEMAMDELTDLPTYMIALKKRLEDVINVLEDCGCKGCKKALKYLK